MPIPCASSTVPSCTRWASPPESLARRAADDHIEGAGSLFTSTDTVLASRGRVAEDQQATRSRSGTAMERLGTPPDHLASGTAAALDGRWSSRRGRRFALVLGEHLLAYFPVLCLRRYLTGSGMVAAGVSEIAENLVHPTPSPVHPSAKWQTVSGPGIGEQICIQVLIQKGRGRAVRGPSTCGAVTATRSRTPCRPRRSAARRTTSR